MTMIDKDKLVSMVVADVIYNILKKKGLSDQEIFEHFQRLKDEQG